MPISDDGRMRIFTIVGDNWACASKYVVDRGPQVIIASPQDIRLSVDRAPDGHMVSGPTTIMAAAFSENQVALEVQIDNGSAQPMTWLTGIWYEANFDFDTVEVGIHAIRVADPNRSDATNGVDEIQVEAN